MTVETTGATIPRRSKRRDLGDGHLRLLLIAALALASAGLAARTFLPEAIHRPGSPLLQSAAILGTLLLLTPFAYVVAKRGGLSDIPNRWLIAHVVASLLGFVLVVVHSGGALFQWPSLLLYGLVALIVTGANARLRVAQDMASTLGRKSAPFAAPDPALKARLRTLIANKTAVLAELEPGASEATFSVTLRHWLRAPMRAARYARLARTEATLVGARASVGRAQAWWRPVHLALAALFLLGLLTHVATVTFFAGYVAGGRAIYWWHLAAW